MNGSAPTAAPSHSHCPKRMVFGPCGGVRSDRTCEVGGLICPFAEQRQAVPWPASATEVVPPLDPFGGAERALVVTDLTVNPFDRGSIEQVTSILSPTCDAVLVGEHQARPDFPPTQMVSLVADAGGRAIVTLTCRDRNRVVLEQELAGLAELGAPGVLCVTGDARAPGVRPGVTQVFDLDGTRLAGLAAENGLTVLVPESPTAEPQAIRPGRLLQKQRAGASVGILNHAGSVAAVESFVTACRSVGVTMPIVAAVAVFTDERSAEVLMAFPGLALPPHAVASVLDHPTPITAGIEAAAAEARALLAIDGVVGVNVSGLASGRGVVAGAEIKRAVGEAIRG